MRRLVAALKQPPRRVFYGIVTLATLVGLWSYTYPGSHFIVLVPVIWVLLVMAIVWVVKSVFFVLARRRGEKPRGRSLVIAPLGLLVVVALVAGAIPLKLRWHFSKAEFEQALATLERDPKAYDEWSDDRTIGLFHITHVDRVKQGYVFHEKIGNLFDDAGFAYLPDGPSPEMENGSFEAPQWYALGDHWYSWTASW